MEEKNLSQLGITMQDIENSLGEGMSLSSTQGNDVIAALRSKIMDNQEEAEASVKDVADIAVGTNTDMSHYANVKTPPIHREYTKVGRNDKCPCGSGKKYKNCCLASGKYEGATFAAIKNPYTTSAE